MFADEATEARIEREVHDDNAQQGQDCDGDVQRDGAAADVDHGEFQRRPSQSGASGRVAGDVRRAAVHINTQFKDRPRAKPIPRHLLAFAVVHSFSDAIYARIANISDILKLFDVLCVFGVEEISYPR